MGVILASAILAKVTRLLLDAGNVKWTEAELLGWLNSGQRDIVVLKSNALTRNESVAAVAGAKQSLPASALVLIDVIRNMGVNGTTPGRAVLGIARDVLDTVIPDWHAAAASAISQYFVYDIRDPKTYYLYPPQPADTAQRLEIVYSVSPVDLTAVSEPIALDDIYEGCLIDYLLYRAFSEDKGAVSDVQQAAFHLQAYQSALGIKFRGEVTAKPPRSQPEVQAQA